MIILEPDGGDVYAHLALEEFMLDRLDELGPSLLFWKSAPAVVIGKNQNPWRECDWTALCRDQVRLARRISGGGTVYHDEGNVNYALILPRATYREDEVLALVLEALRQCGLEAGRMNKNSLAVGNRKISGSAFCYRRNAVLHHGTMLLNTDLARLKNYLAASALFIETRAIASIPAQVMNTAMDETTLRAAWMDVFTSRFGAASYHGLPLASWQSDLDSLRARHASQDWLWGHTPAFSWRLDLPEGRVSGTAEKGRIVTLQGDHPMVPEWQTSLIHHYFPDAESAMRGQY